MYKQLIKIALMLAVMSFLCAASSNASKDFPTISCKTLSGKSVDLPNNIKGKYTILGVAMSGKAEEMLKTWFKPLFYNFIYKSEKAKLFATEYDVNLYFIPMFDTNDESGYSKSRDRMQAGLDEKLKSYVLFYHGDIKQMQKQLGLTSFAIPCFLVLDESGKIVYKTEGEFSESKMMKIEDALDSF